MATLLAHFTDLHLPIPAAPRLGALLNKRALGWLSWSRNRRRRHLRAPLEALVADWRAQRGDAAVITGDLVNIALPEEFEAARTWMAAHFDARATAFLPGNHDCYVAADWAGGLGMLAPFMRGARGAAADAEPAGFDDFPYVFRRGEASVIAANSAPPTAPGLASGRLGAAQIARIEAALGAERDAGRFVILALHHPPEAGVVGARKGLDDAPGLRAAVARAGAHLVLHGHAHFPHVGALQTPRGAAPVIAPGSASHPEGRGRYRPARYGLYRIERAGAGWTLTAEFREYDPESGAVRAVETRAFSRV